jgi:hypothetical protein
VFATPLQERRVINGLHVTIGSGGYGNRTKTAGAATPAQRIAAAPPRTALGGEQAQGLLQLAADTLDDLVCLQIRGCSMDKANESRQGRGRKSGS